MALDVEKERLLREALESQALAQAAQIRAEAARAEAESERELAEAARRRASFLATVTRRLAESTDLEGTLGEVVGSAVPAIADWGAVTLAQPHGALRLVATAHRDEECAHVVAEALGQRPRPGSSAARVVAAGEAEIVRDAGDEDRAALFGDDGRRPDGLEVRDFATWPIRNPQGETIGALTLVLGASGRWLTEDDLGLGRAVATRAGLHIINARLHAERAEIAQTLQASLLPRDVPVIPGLELASAFLPAGEHNIVGGDFFDVFQREEGQWTAILGDVSGKGAAAAAITAAARNTLRAAALLDPDPAANLALLNRIFVADLSSAQFCTVVAARLEPGPESLVVHLANGGHPPPFVVRSGGAVEPVADGRGPLVGILTDAAFSSAELHLSAGDLLLLYTDGVTEARRRDVTLGERRLVSTLEEHAGQSAAEVVDAVTGAAVALQQGTPRDDIAVLAIRVRPA